MREKAKQAEAALGEAELQLRKLTNEKRNLEDLMRMERDKFINLEIELKKVKKENEIAEKDRQAEIKTLRLMLERKEAAIEKELTTTIHNLQDQLKVREERYQILIQKLDSQQKEQQNHLDKEAEMKILQELMTRSHVEPYNQTFQDKITSALEKLSEIEARPVAIPHIDTHDDSGHDLEIARLQEVPIPTLSVSRT